MTVEGWPLENAGAAVNARDYRRLTEAVGLARGRSSGVTSLAALKVTQRGAGANMSVDVASGGAVIGGTENAHQGHYHLYVDATTNLAVAAADPTNPRIDLIVATIGDSEYSGATDAGSITVVTGTPAASPAEPSQPANSIVLARIDVAAGASSIVNANITDRRSQFGTVPAVSAYRASSTSTSHATWKTLEQSVEYWDTHGFHSTATNPSRFTIPTGCDGLYKLDGQVEFAGSAGGTKRSMRVLVDGWIELLLAQDPPGSGGNVLNGTVPGGLRLSAGQYVELQARQDSGGALFVAANAMGAVWLGP